MPWSQMHLPQRDGGASVESDVMPPPDILKVIVVVIDVDGGSHHKMGQQLGGRVSLSAGSAAGISSHWTMRKCLWMAAVHIMRPI